MLNTEAWAILLQKAPHRLQEWIETNKVKSNTPIYITRELTGYVLFIVDCDNDVVTLAAPSSAFRRPIKEYIRIDHLVQLVKK